METDRQAVRALFQHKGGYAIFLLLISLSIPLAVSAGDLPVDGFAAGLYVKRDDMIVENDTTRFGARVDHLGIMLFEQANRYLSLGLLGGIVVADTSNQPLTEGMQLQGNHLGIAMSGMVLETRRWHLGYDLSLIYQSMEDSIGNQHVEMDWLESDIGLNIKLTLSDSVSIYGGPHYKTLDIDQRARGAINATAGFEGQESMEAIFGLALEVDPGGFIDLAVHRGASDGFTLIFSRKY